MRALPFKRPGPRTALFILTVLAPCLVLVAAGLRLVRQERELAEKRIADERRRAASQIGRELLARLEQTKLRVVKDWAPEGGLASGRVREPAVALVGVLRDSQLLLPWETDLAREGVRRALRGGEFGRVVARAEQEEFAHKRFASAADLFREALRVASHAAQSAYARLALARVFHKLGRVGEAQGVLQELLSTPAGVRDEHGVPFALYAADRLVERGVAAVRWQRLLPAEFEARMPPAAVLLLKGLADRTGTPEQRQRLAEWIAWIERAEALKRDLGSLMLRYKLSDDQNPVWIPHGDPPWLVGLASGLRATEKLVVGVDPVALLREMDPSGLQLSTREVPDDLALGDPFPGVRVRLPAAQQLATREAYRSRETFTWAALWLVLIVTLFGAYLSWVDVRREVRLSRMRAEFVSSVSHELKTPLAAIRMFAETLRMRTNIQNPIQAECVDTIISESERLSRLVDNVLDFSKIEQGRKMYRMAPVELPRVVEAAARTMRYPLERGGFTLHVGASDELPAVSGDADALEQAILNLLANAVKYSGDAREIRLSLHRDRGHAVIRVRDAGVGIAPAEQKRIFERFYRVPSPENQAVPGAGLGLTLVEHVAKAHRGSVEVESAPGQGSTFSIRLPIRGAA